MTHASRNPFDRTNAPAHHHAWTRIASEVRFGREITEAAAFAMVMECEPSLERGDIDTIIGMMLDAGIARSTVMDGGEFGFLPALVAA